MNDKIEIKVNKFLFVIFALVVFMIVFLMNKLFVTGIVSSDLAIVLICISVVIQSIILYKKFFSNSATCLTLENDTLEIKFLVCKPIRVPLVNITKIVVWGNVKRNRHWYNIKYDGKVTSTCFLSFLKIDRSVDRFIEELQRRVDDDEKDVNS